MAGAVYLVCAATALICSILLFRKFRQSKFRLLFWSGTCFGFLAIENIFLFLDVIIFPDMELFYIRSSLALIAVSVLLFGLIWEK